MRLSRVRGWVHLDVLTYFLGSKHSYFACAAPHSVPGQGAASSPLQPPTPIPHPTPPYRYARLCVLPPNTPAPSSMLGKLWQVDAQDVKFSLAALAAKGILNVAQLPDGRVWCLPQAQQLELLQAACRDVAPRYHRLLLDTYCSAALPSILEEGPEQQQQEPQQQQEQQKEEQQEQEQYHWQPPPPGSQQQQQPRPSRGVGNHPAGGAGAAAVAALLLQHAPHRLQSIPDDGYILINLGHHLTAAGRHQQVGAGTAVVLGAGWARRRSSACRQRLRCTGTVCFPACSRLSPTIALAS